MSSTRGYSSYRGKGNPWKVLGAIALVLVILACVGYLFAQNHIVYDDEGRARLELPFWQRKAAEEASTPLSQDEVEVEYLPPESSLHSVAELHAAQLPAGTLKLAFEDVVLPEDEALMVEVKQQNGAITYETQADVPPQVYVEGDGTLETLQAILAEDRYTVARMSALCDSYFVRAEHDAAFLLAGGTFWYDRDGWTWLDPASPQVLGYLTSLCREYAALGFDEILLDYFSYPLAGRMESLAIDESVDRVQTLHDLAAALRAALPEDVALSVVIRADLTEATGLTADTVEELFDRVYVAPGVDSASALADLSDSYRTTPGRVVPMVYAATGEGSYAVVPAVQ